MEGSEGRRREDPFTKCFRFRVSRDIQFVVLPQSRRMSCRVETQEGWKGERRESVHRNNTNDNQPQQEDQHTWTTENKTEPGGKRGMRRDTVN